MIDVAILVGTDFNRGIKGIGPKTALRLIKKNENIENLPDNLKSCLTENFKEVRNVFLEPPVTDNYSINYHEMQEEALIHFLWKERDFSLERVKTVIDRMKKFYADKKQMRIENWFSNGS